MGAFVVLAYRNDGALEQIIGRMSLEPFVTAVSTGRLNGRRPDSWATKALDLPSG